MQAERSITSDIESMLQNTEHFAASFHEEANFCAGTSQIHTHSPTCVKYSINRVGKSRDLCRFKAPWKLVDNTHFTDDGVLHIRRNHDLVNRWNQSMAVGLRHNHDISFIGTQKKTMAIVYYVTNYATKVEDPSWKRAAAAAEIFRDMGAILTDDQPNPPDNALKNKTRQFLMKVANRIFTERPLSQVEVAASLLGYDTELTSTKGWAFLNVNYVYWHIFRRWNHLRQTSPMDAHDPDDSVMLGDQGRKISLLEAYPHRGALLQRFSLYDYLSAVQLRRRGNAHGRWGEIEFSTDSPLAQVWVQQLRRPTELATVCLDGYLAMDFDEDDDVYHRRYATNIYIYMVTYHSTEPLSSISPSSSLGSNSWQQIPEI